MSDASIADYRHVEYWGQTFADTYRQAIIDMTGYRHDLRDDAPLAAALDNMIDSITEASTAAWRVHLRATRSRVEAELCEPQDDGEEDEEEDDETK